MYATAGIFCAWQQGLEYAELLGFAILIPSPLVIFNCVEELGSILLAILHYIIAVLVVMKNTETFGVATVVCFHSWRISTSISYE